RQRMMTRICLATILVFACCMVRAADLPIISVEEAVSPTITLDGRMDEDAWRDAALVTLTQQSPNAGAPSAYVTEVRVLVARDRLYFGFACYDPHPESIVVHSLQRDPDLSGDDFVAIALDTYGDHRTGYFFEINAAGALEDGLIAGPESSS